MHGTDRHDVPGRAGAGVPTRVWDVLTRIATPLRARRRVRFGAWVTGVVLIGLIGFSRRIWASTGCRT